MARTTPAHHEVGKSAEKMEAPARGRRVRSYQTALRGMFQGMFARRRGDFSARKNRIC